jgi:hypothetical protein
MIKFVYKRNKDGYAGADIPNPDKITMNTTSESAGQIVDEFKNFLLAVGFAKGTVDKIGFDEKCTHGEESDE